MSDIETTPSDLLEELADIPRAEVESGLKILGAPSFVRKGFPLLGLLATVYEHVSTRVTLPHNEPEAASDAGDAEKA